MQLDCNATIVSGVDATVMQLYMIIHSCNIIFTVITIMGQVLSELPGSLLEDDAGMEAIAALLRSMDEEKEKEGAIDKALEKGERARKEFLPCATYIAGLWRAVNAISAVQPMYRLSAPW